jgi:phospholipase/carboxylesterase
MSTIRGEHVVPIAMSWRMDGASNATDAPLIFALHGMGMDEDSFAELLRGLFLLPLRVLVPRAPYPVEVRREGRIGASWYAYDGDQERFRRELLRSEATLLALLGDVERAQGLRPRARYLLGFSQGGYCGAYAAIRHPEIFRGMIICGARVKTEFLEEETRNAAARGFRALLCHGRRDESVPFEAAERGRAALASAGVDVELVPLEAGHSLGRAAIEAISRWLERQDALLVSPPGPSGSPSSHR